MANNKRTIHIGLDYSQFTGGVTEINRKMGLLDAEFKLATEQAKNYGDETDELGVKQEYLTQKIILQTRKVEEAKQAYDAAMSSQQASEKEIDELDKRLLNERTKLEQLNGSLQQTVIDTDKANGANKTFGDTIRGLASSLGLDVSPALEAVAKKFDGISASLGTAVLGLGAIFTAFAKLSRELAKTADELNTLSAKTGLTTQEIQRLQYACQKVDVDFNTYISSTEKLVSSMDKARKGTNEQSEAFKKLHIRITDGHGKLRDQYEVFNEVIDVLGKMKNETERNAIAQDLLGMSVSELNPLIKAGSEAFESYKENAKGILTDEEIERAQAYDDAVEELNAAWTALKLTLGEFLLPILTKIANFLAQIPTPILKIIVVVTTLIAIIALVVKAILGIKAAMTAINAINTAFQTSGVKTMAIIIAITAALIALAAIIAIIAGKKDDINETLASAEKSMEKLSGTITQATEATASVGRKASGTDYYQGGRTWVGEEGPEIVDLPRGSRIMSNKQSAQMVGATNNYYITIDAKNVQDFNHVVELAKQMPMAARRV